MKKKSYEDSLTEFTKGLSDAYHRWVTIYEEGSSDRMWGDGVNIQLVRNHILYYKGELEKLLKGNFFMYPDLYWVPTPPPLPCNFMATTREVAQEMTQETKHSIYGLPEKAQDILSQFREVGWKSE